MGESADRVECTMVVKLPEWLDNLIFGELKAKFCPQHSDMTNINDNKEETLNYLGTYFPRSYAESYCIFSEHFQTHGADFLGKEELSIFDFGCGTGGEIIGLLTALKKQFPNLKKTNIVALDGNLYALRLYEKILNEFQKHAEIEINSKQALIRIDDFYDLNILNQVMNKPFDIIISFKVICEFATINQFKTQNPYEHLTKFMLKKLANKGLLLIEDVTSKNNTSQEWLPSMMDKGLNNIGCAIIAQNEGYNQTYTITHSHKINDVSKVAWRMIKTKIP